MINSTELKANYTFVDMPTLNILLFLRYKKLSYLYWGSTSAKTWIVHITKTRVEKCSFAFSTSCSHHISEVQINSLVLESCD
jgi:hypothetical protein